MKPSGKDKKGSTGSADTTAPAAGAGTGTPDRIVKTAEKYKGDTTWAKSTKKDNFGAGSWKCNKFVYDVMIEVGVSPKPELHKPAKCLPIIEVCLTTASRPPHAREWADPGETIPGWEVVDDPQPGDIAAYDGHVGFVHSSGMTVSAAEDAVVVNDWGFRPGQSPTFRRFTGK
jgi:hypothetical protein